MLRFITNCCANNGNQDKIGLKTQCLSVQELVAVESSIAQEDHFKGEIESLVSKNVLPSNSCLLSLHPFLDSSSILRVGDRDQNSKLSYSSLPPVILHGDHPVTSSSALSICMLHAGPTLLTSSLCRRFHIIGCRKIIRTITHGCIICHLNSAKPQSQMLGQLPIEHVTPGSVFEKLV